MSLHGRPPKLTPEVQEAVVRALLVGSPRAEAAAAAGIDVSTLRRWVARGRMEAGGPFASLARAVADAEARFRVFGRNCIARAIQNGDWRAAKWYFERREGGAPEEGNAALEDVQESIRSFVEDPVIHLFMQAKGHCTPDEWISLVPHLKAALARVLPGFSYLRVGAPTEPRAGPSPLARGRADDHGEGVG